MKYLGVAHKILGMEIRRSHIQGKLFLHQESYILKVLDRFGMIDAKHEKISLGLHFRLLSSLCPNTDADADYMTCIPYSSVVGSLMYAMIYLRPDISYAVSLVSRYMSNPSKEHGKVVKHILKYLRGIVDYSLQFGRDKSYVLGYIDVDYGEDRDKRRSISGFVFIFGGCAISWKSSLQHFVTLSTTEAEYIAVTEGVKEAIWLKGILSELYPASSVNNIFCDSQSAIHWTKDQVHHERSKYDDIRYHFIHDIIAEDQIIIAKFASIDNTTDMMIKPLVLTKFEHCRNLVGLLLGD